MYCKCEISRVTEEDAFESLSHTMIHSPNPSPSNNSSTFTSPQRHSTSRTQYAKSLYPNNPAPRKSSANEGSQPTTNNPSQNIHMHLNHKSLRFIPQNISFMRHLKLLNLSHNSLISLVDEPRRKSNSTNEEASQTTDKKHAILNLPYLEKLYLHDNSLSCIEGLQHLRSLRILNLSNNTIHIVSGLEALTNLRVLDLSQNQISLFEDNDTFALLTHLEYLDLSENMLKELPILKNNHKLHTLKLDNNFLSDDIWKNQRAERSLPFESIQVLHLQKNEFKSFISFHTLGKMHSLTELVLTENPMFEKAAYSGVNLAPFLLYMIPQLEVLVLKENKMNSSVPQEQEASPEFVTNGEDISAIKEKYFPLFKKHQMDTLIEEGVEVSILNLLESLCPLEGHSASSHRGATVEDSTPSHAQSSSRDLQSKSHSAGSESLLQPDISRISTTLDDVNTTTPHISQLHHGKRNILPSPGDFESYPRSSFQRTEMTVDVSSPLARTDSPTSTWSVSHSSRRSPHSYSSPLSQSRARRIIRENVLSAHRAKREKQKQEAQQLRASAEANIAQLDPNHASETMQSKSNRNVSQDNSTQSSEWKKEFSRLQKQVKEMRNFYKIFLKDQHQKRSRAALRIQRAYRYYRVRKLYHKECKQLEWKRQQLRKERMDKKFTSWKSMFPALRRRVKSPHSETAQDMAAVKVQSLWRGYRARRQLENFLQEDSAAQVIQYHWKIHKAKTDKFYRLQQQLDQEIKTREKLQEAMRFLWNEVSALRAWREEHEKKCPMRE